MMSQSQITLANECFNLGERIPDNQMVKKLLRTVLPKFDVKVTTIEESNDLSTITLTIFGEFTESL